MKVRALDGNHDWCFGRGMVNYLTGSKAIAQSVKTRLLMLKNDWFLGMDDGIAWFDYFEKNPDVTSMEGDIKTAVTSVYGVDIITDFDVLLDSETRSMKIKISYDDIYKNNSEVIANVGD